MVNELEQCGWTDGVTCRQHLLSVGAVSIIKTRNSWTKRRKSMLNVCPWKHRKPESVGLGLLTGQKSLSSLSGLPHLQVMMEREGSFHPATPLARGWSWLRAHFLSRLSHHALSERQCLLRPGRTCFGHSTSSQAKPSCRQLPFLFTENGGQLTTTTSWSSSAWSPSSSGVGFCDWSFLSSFGWVHSGSHKNLSYFTHNL